MKFFIGNVVLAIISSLIGSFCQAQEPFPESALFASDSILELTLVTEMDKLLSYSTEEPSYQDARLVYKDPLNQQEIEMDIEVRARGKFRRKPENCDFPPLKIKFSKKEKQGSIFEDLKDVKLVTHCQTGFIDFDQYVLEEFLIYKAYNIFTDYSFKVRLAKISYLDLSGQMDTITRYAFILESVEHMAERNKCYLLELESVPVHELNQSQLILMSMFNYMMLNSDFSVPIVHNIELIRHDHFSPPIPVPYDFDWSGIINIPYESPFAGSKTKYSGRQYKGPCMKRKEMQQIFSTMLSKSQELLDMYGEFPYIDKEHRSRSLHDLTMFYIIISNKELIRQEFIKNCKD